MFRSSRGWQSSARVCASSVGRSWLCCSGVSRVRFDLFPAVLPRFQPLSLLAALLALLGGGLVVLLLLHGAGLW